MAHADECLTDGFRSIGRSKTSSGGGFSLGRCTNGARRIRQRMSSSYVLERFLLAVTTSLLEAA